MTLFSVAAAEFWLRYIHYIFGILWIGHLYYFNFSQMAFMAETDAATKSQVFQKLTPKTMFWFRWGAMITFLTGWAMILHKTGVGVPLNSAWGTIILSGGLIGTLMFLNVWLIIWPSNKLAIDNATRVANGESAIPGLADIMARAAVASRTNTVFSIPMLFFMGASRHLGLNIPDDFSPATVLMVVTLLILALELNALKGKLGYMATVKGVIHCGVGLLAVLYALIEVLV